MQFHTSRPKVLWDILSHSVLLLYDQACSELSLISGAMEPKEKKAHACNDLICT